MRTVNGVVVLSVLGALVACDAGAPPRKPDCLTAALHLLADMTNKDLGRNPVIKRCEDDQWTIAATTCMANGRSGSEMLDCRFKHLTGAQDEALGKVLDSLVETDSGAALAAMESFRAQMCACNDSTCATQVRDAMSMWTSEQQKQGPQKPSNAQRLAELLQKTTECMTVAMSQPRPTPECDEVSCVLNNYEGACCAKFVHGHGADRTMLDRAMISDGVAKQKAAIMACGDKSDAKGKVKVKVRVGPDGRVSSVVVDTTPDPALGACVAAAMKKATFAMTDDGGSFSYPFIF